MAHIISPSLQTISPNVNGHTPEHKHLYKQTTPTNWKEAYRQRCFERMKNNRRCLLSKFRKLDNATRKSAAKAEVEQVMSEELKTLQEENDNIPFLISGNEDEGFPDDVDDDMIAFIEKIEGELLEEEQRFLESSMSENLTESEFQALVEQYEMSQVTCPVCQKDHLCQSGLSIYCSCGMRICTQERLSCDSLKERLSEGVTQHSATCLGHGTFCLMNVDDSTNLIMTCKDCDFMYIVI